MASWITNGWCSPNWSDSHAALGRSHGAGLGLGMGFPQRDCSRSPNRARAPVLQLLGVLTAHTYALLRPLADHGRLAQRCLESDAVSSEGGTVFTQ